MRTTALLALAALMSPLAVRSARSDIIVATSDRNVYAEEDGNGTNIPGLPGYTPFNALVALDTASSMQKSNITTSLLSAQASANFLLDSELLSYADTNFYVVFSLSAPHTYSFTGSVFSDDPDGSTFSSFTLVRQLNNTQIPIITLFDNGSVTQSGVLPAGNYVLNGFASADNSSFDFGGFGTQQGTNAGGFTFNLTLTPNAVPEPTSLGIVGMLGLCGWVARRQRRA